MTREPDANANNNLDAATLQSMLDSLKSDIIGKIDVTSVNLLAEIASVRQELITAIDLLQHTVDARGVTIQELELAASDHSDKIHVLEATVNTLSAQVKKLEAHCEDYEGRSRLNNLRISGVDFPAEDGSHVTDFVARLLQDLLGLDEKPLLDRAHRTGLQGARKEGEPPRPCLFIARVHFFHIRNLILQRTNEASPLLYKGKRIYISPDYTQAVAKKRAAFITIKRKLQSLPSLKYGLQYPAMLRITLPDGTSHRFEDPSKATDFVNDWLLEVYTVVPHTSLRL